jgi:hypothetical protein
MQALTLALALAVLAQEADPKPAPPTPTETRVIPGGGRRINVVIDDVADGAITVGDGLFLVGEHAQEVVARIEVSPHWIGLGCSPATDPLRAQLGLKDEGVVVYDIVDGSPAQTAGFQKHDVLLKASVHGGPDIDLKNAEDLVVAVKAANLKPFQVFLMRSGKPLTLDVTPKERPQPGGVGARLAAPKGVVIDPDHVRKLIQENQLDELKKYIEQQTQAIPALTTRLHMAGPVVAPPAPAHPGMIGRLPEMPDDLTITITKTGKELAVIKVERGGNWWRATENELETIPEELRAHVQRLLQDVTVKGWKTAAPMSGRYTVRSTTTKTAPATAAAPPQSVKPLPPYDVHRQLEQQQKQLDAVLQQIEDLKKSLEKSAKQ